MSAPLVYGDGCVQAHIAEPVAETQGQWLVLTLTEGSLRVPLFAVDNGLVQVHEDAAGWQPRVLDGQGYTVSYRLEIAVDEAPVVEVIPGLGAQTGPGRRFPEEQLSWTTAELSHLSGSEFGLRLASERSGRVTLSAPHLTVLEA